MTPMQQKLPSGKLIKANLPLPVPASAAVSVFVLGTERGALKRFLETPLVRQSQRQAIVAPRLVQLAGRPKKQPNYATPEAMELRSAGEARAVVYDWKHAAKGGLCDMTPAFDLARATLWQMPPAQRHEALMAGLAGFPADSASAPGEVFTVVVLTGGAEKPIRQRLASLSMLEGPADHVLFDLVHGNRPEVLRGTILVTDYANRFVMRIDPQDPRTSDKAKLLGVLSAAEKLFSGLALQDGDDASALPDGVKLPTSSADTLGSRDTGGSLEQPAEQDRSTPGAGTLKGPSPEEEADQLARALGAADAAETPTPRQTAEERRRAERSAQLAEGQARAEFPTRAGRKARISDLLQLKGSVPVKPPKASGRFLSPEVAEPKFGAISTSYLESGVYDSDIAKVLTSLSNDPLQPFYVKSVTRENTSDSLTLKETVSVVYADARGRTGTVRFDLPIIQRDGYMTVNGVRLHVTKQILAKPVIKVRPDEVLITTAYNKATVERFGQNASPRSVYLRQLASWIEREKPRGARVELNDSTPSNRGFVSTVEYDDVAKSVRGIWYESGAVVFSRPALAAALEREAPWAKDQLAKLEAEGGHPVGWSRSGERTDVLALDSEGRLLLVRKGEASPSEPGGDSDLAVWVFAMVQASIPEALRGTVPAPGTQPRKFMYSRVKMLSQYLPTAVIAGYVLGLQEMLKRAGIPCRMVEREAFKRSGLQGQDAIRFEDSVLVYDARRIRDTLLVNGLKELDTEERAAADFGPGGIGWVDHIADRLGSPGHAKALVNFQASFIDPMTREILEDEGLPTDMAGVLLHASSLLADNRSSEPNDMANYRIRGPELVAAMLYKALHKEMEAVRRTRESPTPQKLSIAQNEVIRQLVAASNVEEVKELNPLDEAEIRGKATWTGASGGLGDGRTVNRAMRAYHPSMLGLFGYYSPDSGEIGVKRTLAYSGSVATVRGKIDPKAQAAGAPGRLALGELISPFSGRHSDPPRIGMQSKQGTHTMPVLRHTPLLVGSGAEKSLAHAIGNTFAFKAKLPGKVEAVDASKEIVRLRYDDGSVGYVDLSSRSVKNSGGGFYITSRLQPSGGLKEGKRFDAGEILAYDPSYFSQRDGSTAYKTGLLVRVALVALDQTYEDSLMVTADLVENTSALVTMSRTVSLGAKANLQAVAKVGDVVTPNTALATFENVTDDADVSELLRRVGSEFDEAVADLTKNVAAAKYAGTIVEMRVYYNRDPEELSPSLQRFLAQQERLAAARAKAVADAPADEPVRVVRPMRINRDKVAGEPVDGLLINFLIQVRDVAAPGDKYVTSSPLKGVISRVFERGEEPTSEDGKQVDYIISPLSIVSRMTTDVFLAAWSNAVLVGLKEKVLDIASGE